MKLQRNHFIVMIFGCLLMVGIFLLVAKSSDGLTNKWLWLMILVCPLLHIFMMRGHHDHQHCHDKQQDDGQKKQPEEKKDGKILKNERKDEN